MSSERHTETVAGLKVRPFEPKDQQAVARLYAHGLLAGQLAPNDTGADIENIREAYFDDERHHFWVAEVDGQVLGMIGVGSDDENTAEIRRLRVDSNHQQTEIPSALIKTAINHCRHHGYLKVVLDTRFSRDAAVDLFDHVGFQHTRTRSVHDKEMLEFYLDLYRQPKHDTDGHDRPDDQP
ncbi:GNAT family N-acetyltransferase [Phycisphaerales bacterium AB-hyl4]|uniref:GNAT family N-acetyltransferase n=1 Tax=Natronomicrosphaera hydrolytica TaxID=3242702 RepID=A0ABV4U4P1_9BACT